MYKYAAITTKGIRKEQNEDRVMLADKCISDGEHSGETQLPVLAIVCDGVGGEAFGDEAASIAARLYLRLPTSQRSRFDIIASIFKANELVCRAQQKHDEGRHMSTTLAGVSVDALGNAIVFNVGDTRIYCQTADILTVLSRDHKAGNALSQYIGIQANHLRPHFSKLTLPDYSSLLICSDGVYKHISEPLILRALQSEESPQQKSRALLNAAVQQGSEDDISVVVLSYSRTL